MRLVLAGWGLAVLVAVLTVVVDGFRQVGFALVLVLFAAAMATWTWRRATRAAMIASLVLGALLLLSFGGYVVAAATGDDFDSQVFFTDLLGTMAGVAIVAGAIQTLIEKRRQPQASLAPRLT
jgi:uncharacterized membrane protein